MNRLDCWDKFLEYNAKKFELTERQTEIFKCRFTLVNQSLNEREIFELLETLHISEETFVGEKSIIYQQFTNLPGGYSKLSDSPHKYKPLKEWLKEKKYPEWLETYSPNDSNICYLERANEYICFKELLQENAFVRVKAPKRFGKTTLMNRILSGFKNRGYQTACFDFGALDRKMFSNYERFCQGFCAGITHTLNLSEQVANYWLELLGSNQNTTRYFEEYLLPTIEQPTIIGLDGLDCVFEQNEIATDFCRLLRGWRENRPDIWQKLKLIIAHNTDVYSGLSINNSPLAGIGMVIPLAPFSIEEVQSLAQLHKLPLNFSQFTELMKLTGGHPYLVSLAFEHLRGLEKAEKITGWQKFIRIAPSDEGIYRNHLLELAGILNQNQRLATAFAQVIEADEPIFLASDIGFKLVSLGLVKVAGNLYSSQCELYRQYFLAHIDELR